MAHVVQNRDEANEGCHDNLVENVVLVHERNEEEKEDDDDEDILEN